MKKILLSTVLFSSVIASAQNVGINSTGAAPVTSAALDVDMANKGVLIPRVALTTTTAFAPVTGVATASLLVYNTASAGVFPNNVTAGYYYWDGAKWVRLMSSGSAWIVGTSTANVNTPGATGYFGTSDNNNVDLVTNGTVRGRLSSLGEFFIGTTATALPGDLMNGVSNATFPWAINGYSSQNGSGVYGSVQAGATIFGAVQGEYYGTHVQGTGVRGINSSATGGTGFNAASSGVYGDATYAVVGNAYKFGVFGTAGSVGRSGGVMGYDYGYAYGSLGYFTSGGADICVYGFGQGYTVGIAGGKPGKNKIGEVALTEANTNIGLGIYGGVMGGWMRGLVYGTHVKGERYSLYVDGKTYMNEPITQLVAVTGDERQTVYGSSAMKVEISDRGKSTLTNGQAYIAFSDAFKQTISSNPDELTITVSPMGNSNGIYILSYDENGFTVMENNSGSSAVAFNWIAIGTRKDYETMSHSPEVIATDFDTKMNGVMYNDYNTTGTAQPIWWDGTNIRWDAPPARNLSNIVPTGIRPKEQPATPNAPQGIVE
ncbi:MAG: hypothetical protein V4604_05435 [Bacteroidota bacterium]